jgi:hypothetical protein
MKIKQWDILLETNENNVFTLTIFADNERNAKSKAKKYSNHCKILGVKEVTAWARDIYPV